MQITSVQPGSMRSGEITASATRLSSTDEIKKADKAVDAPLRNGLSAWKPDLNQEMSTAQKVLAFLREAEGQLQSLKAELSFRLGNRQGSDAKLEQKIQKFDTFWSKRRQETAGSLNGQLAYEGTGNARQSFRIAGLGTPQLQAGAKEKLEFSIGTDSVKTVSVTLDEGMSVQDVARRLDQALYPINLRAHVDKQGAISFSVPESMWHEVRGSLAIKGNGIRVADGRMHRVNVEALPEAVRPGEWRTDDAAMMRRTLQDVVQTLDWIGRARQTVDQVLAEIRREHGDFSAQVDTGWAYNFVKKFESLTTQPQYQLFFSIAPALQSVTRSRVQALLALR